jgi:hypothetical protein
MGCDPTLCDLFPELLPRKPYAADGLHDGLRILSRPHALRRRHIQFKSPAAYRWMLHDIDQPDAYHAHRDAYVPQPNLIVINPANGHGHAAYLLATPVARHSAARVAPLRFFASVELGIARRIGADRRYCGLIVKNPRHPHWFVEWRRDQPYSLPELADWLFPRDVVPEPNFTTTFGAGRNCAIFDELRKAAYGEVRAFKRQGDLEAYCGRLERLAIGINSEFRIPLSPSEVRAIVKSVTRWTWTRFSDESLARRQSALGRRGATKRWAGHISAAQTKPWRAEGISRRTWYRRKRA